MVDCGEGTQIQLRKEKISFLKISHIFISHLHGDHYFGLVGLISSMQLLGRTTDLHIYAPKEIKEIIEIQLRASTTILRYKIHYTFLETKETELILDDKNLEVHTIPLKHKILCNGFLFKEKPRLLKAKAEKLQYYNIPHYEIQKIKEGKDYTLPNGEVVKNEILTFSQEKSRTYAFCADTAYREKMIPIIKDADLLYLETTFLDKDQAIAKKTFHSTTLQTGKIAKLANVSKLLIGHFSARYTDKDYPLFIKEVKQEFDNVVIADERMTFEIS